MSDGRRYWGKQGGEWMEHTNNQDLWREKAAAPVGTTFSDDKVASAQNNIAARTPTWMTCSDVNEVHVPDSRRRRIVRGETAWDRARSNRRSLSGGGVGGLRRS